MPETIQLTEEDFALLDKILEREAVHEVKATNTASDLFKFMSEGPFSRVLKIESGGIDDQLQREKQTSKQKVEDLQILRSKLIQLKRSQRQQPVQPNS